jgi:hypothetical protein
MPYQTERKPTVQWRLNTGSHSVRNFTNTKHSVELNAAIAQLEITRLNTDIPHSS